ncbi:MAG: hypothetical protein ACYDAE_19625 [Steroidobacteraceae bacterium]
MSEKKPARRGSRPPSAAARRLRRILAANVAAVIERRYPLRKFGKKSDQQRAIAKDVGSSWSTIQRRLDPEKGATLDVVADIAAALRLEPHDLLNPAFIEQLDLPRPEGGEDSTPFHRTGG